MYRFFPDDGTRALIELRFGHIISFFFFNDTATTEIYTLSLHDALPILLTLFPPTRAEAEGPSSEWNPQIPPIRTTTIELWIASGPARPTPMFLNTSV